MNNPDPPTKKDKEFEQSESGFKAERLCISQFTDWLNKIANLNAQRRDSKTVTDSDFQTSFKHLVTPPLPRNKFSFKNTIAKILIGVGAYLFIGNITAKPIDWTHLIIGVVCLVAGTVLEE